MAPLRFGLENWAAWSPGLQTQEDWRLWAAGQPKAGWREQMLGNDKSAPVIVGDNPSRIQSPAVNDIPMMTRRRLTRLGRMALRVALDAGACEQDHLVFASRYGDSTSTASMLKRLAEEKSLSPTDFSMSVHNAYAGMLSILQKNTHSHTAISAGEESFCAGLLEAALILKQKPERDVLMVFYEEQLAPDLLGEDRTSAGSVAMDLAVALRLSAQNDCSQLLQFGRDTDVGHENAGAASAKLESLPPGLGFVRYLAGDEKNWRWQGVRNRWWCRCDGR